MQTMRCREGKVISGTNFIEVSSEKIVCLGFAGTRETHK